MAAIGKKAGRKQSPVKGKKAKSTSSTLERIFVTAGFQQITVDGTHFQIRERMGELDFAFVYENVLVLCEDTAKNDISEHFSKKQFFHGLIGKNTHEFCEVLSSKCPQFKLYLESGRWSYSDLEVRHIYYSSTVDLDAGLRENSAPLKVLDRSHAKYFVELVKVVGRSAKYELFKYLKISLGDIGVRRSSGMSAAIDPFDAFLLPGNHTHYPQGFCVVSFYADPKSLLQRAYVLRRDGWEQDEVSYQRFLKASKLASMRRYLANDGKVFVNNLIVTLPSTATLSHPDSGGQIEVDRLTKKVPAKLGLPLELGTVGIVDGQHRIFAYYEGTDAAEQKIDSLRVRQNLLVTGIVFPENYSAEKRVKFEAELFLSINDTQTGVRSDLRQALETIIKPDSLTAIAKAVVNKLSAQGPLNGLLQRNIYDPVEKIRVASLVRYVVSPLVRPDAKGVMFNAYQRLHGTVANVADVRAEYVEFCAEKLNAILAGARASFRTRWKSVHDGGALNPLVIGGILFCLREVYERNNGFLTLEDYRSALKNIDQEDFDGYGSSHWAQLGKVLYGKYFEI